MQRTHTRRSAASATTRLSRSTGPTLPGKVALLATLIAGIAPTHFLTVYWFIYQFLKKRKLQFIMQRSRTSTSNMVVGSLCADCAISILDLAVPFK